MMTQFCCLPAQVIQAPCLLSSAQGPASLCCCSWTHKHRHCAWSSCVVYVGQRWSGQLSAALDCTRLNRKEVGYVRASHAQSKLLAAKKGCHYTLGNATFCKRLRPRHRVIRLDCAPADDINDLVLADANAADNSISDLASTEEEDTGSFGAPGSASTVYIGKDSNNLPKEGQRVRECPIERLQELLLVAQQELENARANSAKLEETAQRIAEEAFVVRDQAVEAKNAAKLANQEFENILGQEARVEDTLEKARVALTTAGVKVMLAEDALAEVLEKLNADQSDHAIRLFRNRVAPFPAELTQGLTFGGSLESEIVSGNSNAAGAVNDAEDFAPQVSLIPINSEEFVLSPSVLSDVDMVKAENQNREGTSSVDGYEALAAEKAEELSRAHMELKHAETTLQKLEEDLARMRSMKSEFLKLATHLREVARKANENAAAAHDDAAYAMSLAEQAVAWEVEAAQRVSDAEMKLQKAETHAADALQAASLLASAEMAHKLALQVTKASDAEHEFSGLGAERMQVADEGHGNGLSVNGTQTISERLDSSLLSVMDDSSGGYEDLNMGPNFGISSGAVDSQRKAIREVESESRRLDVGSIKEEDIIDRPRMSENLKRLEVVKEGTSPGIAKAVKRSSRFFSASYFSFAGDGVEYFPNSLFSGLAAAVKRQLPKVLIGVALLAGGWVLNSQLQRQEKLLPSDWTSSTLNVKTDAKPLSFQLSTIPRCMKKLIDRLPPQEVNDEETSLFDVIWLLLASVVFVPIFQKMPGGSPVLGYLAAGVLIGPYTLSIIKHVHGTKAIAEFGVVFLLFNIGLELSVERLSSMKKYVFGFGSSQVLCTALCIGLFAHQLASISVPAAIIVGNGLALSSTAVVLQVLQERGESTSRHGRATFSVLLFQDLAVVVLLILIPLLSPNSSKGGVGLQAIAEALGIAAIKAVMAISGIIAGGRLLLRPAYKRMAENHNPEIFAANTLLIVLGTSLLTARAGLSMALGAFLAGLLLAETEYALQVESDIAPYRGLLLGLFFMTVGMSIDPNLFLAKFPVILGALALLVSGKTLLVACVGRQFGLSTVAAVRAGLLLSPGGEFAFVAFGEAVNQGIMTTQLSSLLFLVVGLSMALTPWLAAGGQLIAARFEQQDVRSLLPVENETDDLQDHIIICGFGRVGQIIGQLLAERLIPFVALDVRSERVNMGRGLDLPVYFGDAGSREVLHKVGAGRAAAAVITLDTPGANYRTVWAISKHFPHLKTFVRAHDVDHGISLEKAGATAVVPETLEPSLQLAAAVLAQAKLPASEIAATIDDFRSRHLSELSELSEASGTSLGYGFSRIIAKAKSSSVEVVSKGRLKNDDDGQTERTDGGIVSIGA